MSIENINPSLPPSCSNSGSSTEGDKWFKLEKAYENAKSSIFTLPVIQDSKCHMLSSAIALYSNLFCGYNPQGFPKNIANVIWTTSNAYLRTEFGSAFTEPGGMPVLLEGKAPYIITTETPKSLIKAHSKLESYLSSKLIKKDESKEEKWAINKYVEKLVEKMKIKNKKVRMKLIDFGKFFCTCSKFCSAWGLFFSFIRLTVKNIEHMKSIFTQETKRKKLLALAGFSDSILFQRPNKAKWKQLQKNLTSYKPLLGHFCTYSYLNEPTAYLTIKKFIGLTAEFHGMSILTMAAPVSDYLRLLYGISTFSIETTVADYLKSPNNALLSLAKTTTTDFKKICASEMLYSPHILYVSKDFQEAILKFGETYPELKTMTIDDAKAGRFARLFSADYLPWLSYKKESKMAEILLGLNAGSTVEYFENKSPFGIESNVNYLKAMEVGILLAIEAYNGEFWRKFGLMENLSESEKRKHWEKVVSVVKQSLNSHLQKVQMKISTIK